MTAWLQFSVFSHAFAEWNNLKITTGQRQRAECKQNANDEILFKENANYGGS